MGSSSGEKKKKRVRKRRVRKVVESSSSSNSSTSSSEKARKEKKEKEKEKGKEKEAKSSARSKEARKEETPKDAVEKKQGKKKKKSSSSSSEEEVKEKKKRKNSSSRSSSGSGGTAMEVNHAEYVKLFENIESNLEEAKVNLAEDNALRAESMKWVQETLKPVIRVMRNEFMTDVNALRDEIKSRALDSRAKNISKMTEIQKSVQTILAGDKERREQLAQNRAAMKAVVRAVKDQRSRMAQAVEEIGEARLDGSEMREANTALSKTIKGNDDQLREIESRLLNLDLESFEKRSEDALKGRLKRNLTDMQARLEEALEAEVKQACANACRDVRAQENARAELAQQRRLAAVDPSFAAPERTMGRRTGATPAKPRLRGRTVSVAFRRRRPMMSLARKIDEKESQLKQAAARRAAEEADDGDGLPAFVPGVMDTLPATSGIGNDGLIDFASLPAASISGSGARRGRGADAVREEARKVREARKAKVAAAKQKREAKGKQKKKRKKSSSSTSDSSSKAGGEEATKDEVDTSEVPSRENEAPTKENEGKRRSDAKEEVKEAVKEEVKEEIKVEEKKVSPPENEPAPLEEQEQEKPKPKPKRKWGASEKCVACGKTLYAAEKIEISGKGYHKMGCFKCVVCSTTLKLTTFAFHDNVLYCKPHAKASLADGSHAARAAEVAAAGGAAAAKPTLAPKVVDERPATTNSQPDSTPAVSSGGNSKADSKAAFWESLGDTKQDEPQKADATKKPVKKATSGGGDFWGQFESPKKEEKKEDTPPSAVTVAASNKAAAKEDDELLKRVDAALAAKGTASTKATTNAGPNKKWAPKKKETAVEEFGDDPVLKEEPMKKKRRSKKSKKGNKGGGLFASKSTVAEDDLFSAPPASEGGDDIFKNAAPSGGGLFDLEDFDDDDDLFQ